MSGSWRLALMLLALVFGAWVAIRIVTVIVGTIVSLLAPLMVIGVIALVLYVVVSRKALSGGRRMLP